MFSRISSLLGKIATFEEASTFEVFKRNWNCILNYYQDPSLATSVLEDTDIEMYLLSMVKCVKQEIEDQSKKNISSIGPCMEEMLNNHTLDFLCCWAEQDLPNGMCILVLNVLSILVSNIHLRFLEEKAIRLPIQKIIRICHEMPDTSSDNMKHELVKLVNAIFRQIKTNTVLVNLFVENDDQFFLFSYLLDYMNSRHEQTGVLAREAIHLGVYIINQHNRLYNFFTTSYLMETVVERLTMFSVSKDMGEEFYVFWQFTNDIFCEATEDELHSFILNHLENFFKTWFLPNFLKVNSEFLFNTLKIIKDEMLLNFIASEISCTDFLYQFVSDLPYLQICNILLQTFNEKIFMKFMDSFQSSGSDKPIDLIISSILSNTPSLTPSSPQSRGGGEDVVQIAPIDISHCDSYLIEAAERHDKAVSMYSSWKFEKNNEQSAVNPLIKIVLSLLLNFFDNPPKVNLVLTSIISTIGLIPDPKIQKWLRSTEENHVLFIIFNLARDFKSRAEGFQDFEQKINLIREYCKSFYFNYLGDDDIGILENLSSSPDNKIEENLINLISSYLILKEFFLEVAGIIFVNKEIDSQ
jgi:hypothetical protein